VNRVIVMGMSGVLLSLPLACGVKQLTLSDDGVVTSGGSDGQGGTKAKPSGGSGTAGDSAGDGGTGASAGGGETGSGGREPSSNCEETDAAILESWENPDDVPLNTLEAIRGTSWQAAYNELSAPNATLTFAVALDGTASLTVDEPAVAPTDKDAGYICHGGDPWVCVGKLFTGATYPILGATLQDGHLKLRWSFGVGASFRSCMTWATATSICTEVRPCGLRWETATARGSRSIVIGCSSRCAPLAYVPPRDVTPTV
jgi:hypothetical protein